MASSSEVYGGLVSAKSLRWCGGAVWHMERVSSVLSLTVSVVAQKKAADYTYPIGIDRWNPTIWSSSGVAFGTRNATNGMSSRRTHMRMYASDRSPLLRKVGPSLGGADRMQYIILWSAFTKRHCFFVGYLGDCLLEESPGEFVDEAGFSASLRDGCEGGYPKLGYVVDRS